jgi:DNA-binding PadR family transcriptional regulator
MRLADRNLVEARWQEEPQPGRPRRHLYRLTTAGLASATGALASAAEAAAARAGARKARSAASGPRPAPGLAPAPRGAAAGAAP